MPYKDPYSEHALAVARKNGRKYRFSEKGQYALLKSRLKYRFNITPEQYYEMLDNQNDKCALCGKELNFYRERDTSIDHCHRTGKIRGIVHRKCNLRLQALDDYEWMQKAITYLGGSPWLS